ncbi:MAG: DUF2294 domain-containing protein [Actinomycetota bacterium]|nr:DUF2294 domain-containing protein [Actinomycetota bacterium]
MPDRGPGQLPDQSSVTSAVTEAMAAMHARYYGRRPTSARAFMGADYVLCVLENIYTTAERTLIRAGRGGQVRAARVAFEDALAAEFCATVEEITGRRVRAFLGQTCDEPEIATQVFVLHPLGTEALVPGDRP